MRALLIIGTAILFLIILSIGYNSFNRSDGAIVNKKIPTQGVLDTISIIKGYLDSCFLEDYNSLSFKNMIPPDATFFYNDGEEIGSLFNLRNQMRKGTFQLKRYNRNLSEVYVETTNKDVVSEFCSNSDDLKKLTFIRIEELEGLIQDIAIFDKNSDKDEVIETALSLFAADTFLVEIILSKKNPDLKKTFLTKDYFEWLKKRATPETNIYIDWTENIIIDDFVYDDKLKMYRSSALIEQIYTKTKSGQSLDGEKEVVYIDITTKKIEIYIQKIETEDDENGCMVLFGNIRAIEIK